MTEKTQSVLVGILTFATIISAFAIGAVYFNRDVNEGVRIRQHENRIEIEVDQDTPVDDEYRIRVGPFVDIQGKK